MNKLGKKWALWPVLTLILGITLTVACKKENGGDTDEDPKGFDRKEMLRNYAENLIIPSYSELNVQVKALQSAVNNFADNIDNSHLEQLQEAWTSAYLSWIYANSYNLGPAAATGLLKSMTEEIATFPVSETKIQDKIAANNTNFVDFDRDARGFLGIESLIFRLDDNNDEIVTYFSGNENAVNYLKAITNHITEYVEGVHSGWNSSYTETFINNNGTSVGSSTALLYNEFIKSFETIKNYKIGLPIGNAPGAQIAPNPALVEAYYSGISIQVIKLHIKVIEELWKGTSKNGTQGVGFKAYLESVEGGKALVASTEEQLVQVKAAINALPDNQRLSDLVTSDRSLIENVYLELSKHTRFFKSDMSSLLGIAITYSSGDGD